MRVEAVDGARTRELRREVLRPHLRARDPLPGDDLPGAVHIAALDGDTVVGTCFVFPSPCPWRPDAEGSWRLRQMATVPSRRGTGVGADVLVGAIDAVAKHGGALLWLEARERAVSLYARYGFLREGGIYTDERHRIRHQNMWRPIEARSP